MIVLETERLLLRHLVPADLDALHALYSDPEMRRFYPDGTLTRAETMSEIAWFANGHPQHPQLGLWATVERRSGDFLGRCGLLPWQIDGVDEIELAFMIDKRRWREGLASEAALAIARHAREVLGLKRLVCLIVPGNRASEGVARRLGMRFEREFSDEFGPGHLHAMALDMDVDGGMDKNRCRSIADERSPVEPVEPAEPAQPQQED
jgi:ribosomal-protein-alanine N-acetyltransferase